MSSVLKLYVFHSRLSLTQARYMPFKTFRNGNKSTSPHFLENLRSEVGKETFEGLAGNVYKDITIINRVKMKGCLSQSAF